MEILNKSIFMKIWVYGLWGVLGKCCFICSWKCWEVKIRFFCLYGKCFLFFVWKIIILLLGKIFNFFNKIENDYFGNVVVL